MTRAVFVVYKDGFDVTVVAASASVEGGAAWRERAPDNSLCCDTHNIFVNTRTKKGYS